MWGYFFFPASPKLLKLPRTSHIITEKGASGSFWNHYSQEPRGIALLVVQASLVMVKAVRAVVTSNKIMAFSENHGRRFGGISPFTL